MSDKQNYQSPREIGLHSFTQKQFKPRKGKLNNDIKAAMAKSIARKIVDVRKAIQKTRAQFAKEICCDERTLAYIEQGERMPSMPIMIDIYLNFPEHFDIAKVIEDALSEAIESEW